MERTHTDVDNAPIDFVLSGGLFVTLDDIGLAWLRYLEDPCRNMLFTRAPRFRRI